MSFPVEKWRDLACSLFSIVFFSRYYLLLLVLIIFTKLSKAWGFCYINTARLGDIFVFSINKCCVAVLTHAKLCRNSKNSEFYTSIVTGKVQIYVIWILTKIISIAYSENFRKTPSNDSLWKFGCTTLSQVSRSLYVFLFLKDIDPENKKAWNYLYTRVCIWHLVNFKFLRFFIVKISLNYHFAKDISFALYTSQRSSTSEMKCVHIRIIDIIIIETSLGRKEKKKK